MKFIVDAHLPAALCSLLVANGHAAIHTSQLAAGNSTTDNVINDISLRDQGVVVSKDTDFYHSHLLHGKPHKLLLVRTGNIGVAERNYCGFGESLAGRVVPRRDLDSHVMRNGDNHRNQFEPR